MSRFRYTDEMIDEAPPWLAEKMVLCNEIEEAIADFKRYGFLMMGAMTGSVI